MTIRQKQTALLDAERLSNLALEVPSGSDRQEIVDSYASGLSLEGALMMAEVLRKRLDRKLEALPLDENLTLS